MAIDIRDQDSDQQVLKSILPVVVDFWAPWCGPCGKIGPMVEKLSDEYNGRLKFCKINVDENHDTASIYLSRDEHPNPAILQEWPVGRAEHRRPIGEYPAFEAGGAFLEVMSAVSRATEVPLGAIGDKTVM